MKNLITIGVVLICLILLASCGDKDNAEQNIENTPSIEIERFENDAPYLLRVDEYKTSIEFYYMAPYFSDGMLLASSTENYADEKNARTILYDIETGAEQEVEVFAKTPKFIANNLYYANHSLDQNEHTKLIKRDFNTGEETVVYSVKTDGTHMGLQIATANNYLSWYEINDDHELLVSGDAVAMTCDLIVFDVKAEEVVYTVKDICAFSSAAPPLSDDNKIAFVEKHGNSFSIRVADFLTDEIIYEKQIDAIPTSIDYNNQRLAYLFRGRSLTVIDTYSDTELLSLTGDFTENLILDGRFLVYGTVFTVYVRDLNSLEVIYDSDENNYIWDDGSWRYVHSGHFTVNRESRQVVYRYSDRADYKKDVVVIMSFVKE